MSYPRTAFHESYLQAASPTAGYTSYSPAIYARWAVTLLHDALGLGSRVHRGYDEERKSFSLGDTISVRTPSSFQPQDAPATEEDLKTEFVDIELNRWKEVKFRLELDDGAAITDEEIFRVHLPNAVYAIAREVDEYLASFYEQIPHAIWTRSTLRYEPEDIIRVREVLRKNRVPMDANTDPESANSIANNSNLHFMIHGAADRDFLASPEFATHRGAADDPAVRTQITGILGRKYGLKIFPSQVTPVDADNGKAQNLAFHRNWLALATAPLHTHLAGAFHGVHMATAFDKWTRLSLRVRVWYEESESVNMASVDILYGASLLDKDLCAILQGPTD